MEVQLLRTAAMPVWVWEGSARPVAHAWSSIVDATVSATCCAASELACAQERSRPCGGSWVSGQSVGSHITTCKCERKRKVKSKCARRSSCSLRLRGDYVGRRLVADGGPLLEGEQHCDQPAGHAVEDRLVPRRATQPHDRRHVEREELL